MSDTTYLQEWGLTPEDDTFHPRNDDPWWTETVWFAWIVPERKLVGYFYPVFRPNLGVQAGGVIVFDDSASLPWEVPVLEYDWMRPMQAGIDLRDAKLDNGMSIRCLEPARRFDVGYDGRDLRLDLHVEAVTKPLVTMGTPPFNKGHIDQLCRVTGEMVLQGESVDVDCIAMRDRSWGPRQDGRQPQVGYDYGTGDADNAFLAVALARRGEYEVTTGFLIRDGVWSQLTSGVRETVRDDDGRPVAFTITATDRDGREVVARGDVVSQQALVTYPAMLCWNSLVRWQVDGWLGWGEDQDVWHPRRWRDDAARRRALRA
jgi:hypothetical protein